VGDAGTAAWSLGRRERRGEFVGAWHDAAEPISQPNSQPRTLRRGGPMNGVRSLTLTYQITREDLRRSVDIAAPCAEHVRTLDKALHEQSAPQGATEHLLAACDVPSQDSTPSF
jgi:hypothetical protein